MLLLSDQVGSTNNVSIVVARLVEYGAAGHDRLIHPSALPSLGLDSERRTAVHPSRPILGAA
jgi:hypothetical protein